VDEQGESGSTGSDGAEAPIPATPAPTAPAPASATPKAPAEKQGLNPRLIAVCVGLWIIASVVLVFKAPGMIVDFHLGNLGIGLAEENKEQVEEAARELILRGPDVVPAIRTEFFSSKNARNLPYRLTLLVEVLGRIPGDAATDFVYECVRNEVAAIRANSLTLLGERVHGELITGEGIDEARAVLGKAAMTEPDLVAQAYAARALLLIGNERDLKPAAWTVLVCLRALPAKGALLAPPLVSAIQQALKVDLGFDPALAPKERDAQMRAWEDAFTASGFKIPPGRDVRTWRSRQTGAVAPTTSSATLPTEPRTP
jgi:hypothetical protein